MALDLNRPAAPIAKSLGEKKIMASGGDFYASRLLDALGVRQEYGDPFWEVRATQDYPLERIEWRSSELINGVWILEVEARGYGVTAPIEQLSFYDHFDLYATITKPCVRFAASHEIGECSFLSDLN